MTKLLSRLSTLFTVPNGWDKFHIDLLMWQTLYKFCLYPTLHTNNFIINFFPLAFRFHTLNWPILQSYNNSIAKFYILKSIIRHTLGLIKDPITTYDHIIELFIVKVALNFTNLCQMSQKILTPGYYITFQKLDSQVTIY